MNSKADAEQNGAIRAANRRAIAISAVGSALYLVMVALDAVTWWLWGGLVVAWVAAEWRFARNNSFKIWHWLGLIVALGLAGTAIQSLI